MPPSLARHSFRATLRNLLLLTCASALSGPGVAFAGWRDALTDPDDGRLDLSVYLLERKGALPIPMVITEPAVGYGGGVGLMFFQQSLSERAVAGPGRPRYRPPNVFGGAGFGTENGTWGAGGGGLVSFAEDRWRWRGVAGYVSMNLDFYGFGALGSSAPTAYSLSGVGVMNTVLYRVGSTNAWVAANVRYLEIKSRFEDGPPAAYGDEKRRSSGIGPVVEYDSRDNLFTPGRGWKAGLEGMFYEPAFGSDASFQTWRSHLYAYTPLPGRLVLGTRLDARTASNATPFYMVPYIILRGIPAVRYQGQRTAVVEGEARWNLNTRWALMGFYGAGRAWGSAEDFADADTHDAGGTGFRYLLARRLGVYSGIDFAWGPEFALYLQVGSAWR
jgi:hypothetical protein